MKKTIFSFSIIVVLLSILIYSQIGKTNNVQVSIGESTKFTEKEIDEAIGSVKKKFMSFQGCKLTELWYSESKSDRLIKDYLQYGKGSSNGIKEENVMVLLSNFEVNSSGGDGSFEPNSTQSDWQWILIRDSKSDRWRVDDWGY